MATLCHWLRQTANRGKDRCVGGRCFRGEMSRDVCFGLLFYSWLYQLSTTSCCLAMNLSLLSQPWSNNTCCPVRHHNGCRQTHLHSFSFCFHMWFTRKWMLWVPELAFVVWKNGLFAERTSLITALSLRLKGHLLKSTNVRTVKTFNSFQVWIVTSMMWAHCVTPVMGLLPYQTIKNKLHYNMHSLNALASLEMV